MRNRIDAEICTPPQYLSLTCVQEVFDVLPSHMAILDHEGRIVATNPAWERFSFENGGSTCETGIGANYLQVCDLASCGKDERAQRFAAGLRAVMAGECRGFETDSYMVVGGRARLFRGRITRLEEDGLAYFLVSHEDVSSARTRIVA